MRQATSEELQSIILQANEVEQILKIIDQFEKFDATIALVLIDKFEPETTRMWKRQHHALSKSWAQAEPKRSSSQYMPTCEAVKDFLAGEIEMQEAYGASHKQSVKMTSYSDCLKATNTEAKTEMTQAQASHKPEAYLSSVQSLQEAKKTVPSFLKCTLCDGIHPKYKCEIFKDMTLEQRNTHVEIDQLCRKCL